MRADQEKYILQNLHKKSTQQLARELGISERKIKRFVKNISPREGRVHRIGVDEFLASRFSAKRLLAFSVLIIALFTALVFAPSLFNNFIEWDDPEYVYENPFITSFSPENIKALFTRSFQGAYCPLTMVSFACEYHFFKADPFIYHLTNYLLHIAITLLVFFFIRNLSGGIVVPFFAALIFGIHPLHVESVAWIAERKDVLYSFFYMLALLAYQRYLAGKRIRYYLLCSLWAILSFLAKPMAITLPFLLFLLDYMNERKINLSLIIEKIPLFMIAAAVGIISYKFQVLSGVTNVGTDNIVRIYFLSKEIPFYLSKLVFPFPLSAIYKFYNIGPSHMPELYFNMTVLIALSCVVLFSIRRTKRILFGSAFFMITLLPVLKLIPTGDVFAADRYMYIPSIGIFYLAAIFIKRLIFDGTRAMPARALAASFLAAWLFFLGYVTVQRCGTWKDTETFFLDVLRQNPSIPTANNNLGGYYLSRGDYDKAILYLERALKDNVTPALREMIENNLRAARHKKGLGIE